MLRASGVQWIAVVVTAVAVLAGCSPHTPPEAQSAPLAPLPEATAGESEATLTSTAAVEAAITAPTPAAAPAAVALPVIHAAAVGVGEPGVARQIDGAWVVGDGTPASCTSAALVRATRQGGDVRFDCGPEEAVIVMEETLTVCNTVGCSPEGAPLERLRLDGGGRVVLAGTGERPLLYANACERRLGALPGPCERRATPHLTVEHLALIGGSAVAGSGGAVTDLGGGGALAMRGGRLTLSDVMLSGNRCGDPSTGAGGDVLLVEAGAPAEISGSTFAANACRTGGAIALRSTPATIVGANVVDNVATGAGGGIIATGTTEPLEVALSTVSGNIANTGSGIDYAVPGGALTLRLARVEGNVPDAAGSATDIRSDSTVSGSDVTGEAMTGTETSGVPAADPAPAPTETQAPAAPED